jgi:hypothetical protein
LGASYLQMPLQEGEAIVVRTTSYLRQQFCDRHRSGETYDAIAVSEGVSKWTVRYWCRRDRDGCGLQTVFRREPAGMLRRFDPKVRYCVLRLRLEHPRWGPNRILARLRNRPSLRALSLPSQASIGRYLHQWPRFCRQAKQQSGRPRPQQPTAVHQRWQIDFKLGILLQGGCYVNLHTIRDPVGEACIGAFVFPAGKVGRVPRDPQMEHARSALRACFARCQTLPDEIQSDGDKILVGNHHDSFPSIFTLWLKGLDVEHLVTRPARPTDNAEVERCHRTGNDYAIVGQEKASVLELQQILDQAVHELGFELSSRAEGCHGQPPVIAHPELLQPRRPFRPEQELALFDLKRVDTYLAGFTWQRKVGKTGQIEVGRHRYSVGRVYGRRSVLIRFDLTDRHFVFYDIDDPEMEICRRPAKELDVTDLTGLAQWPQGLGIQQLPLPLSIPEGVVC